MRGMMVIGWRGCTWHGGGEDHQGGDRSCRVVRAVSYGEGLHLGDFLLGKEQWSLESSCVAAVGSVWCTGSVYL